MLCEFLDRYFHGTKEEVLYVFLAAGLGAVERGIHLNSSGIKRPAEISYSFNDGVYSSNGDLGIDILCQSSSKATLYRERLVEKLFVEVFLALGNKDTRLSGRIELWPASAAHHLKHVCNGIIDISVRLPIKELGALHNYQMRGKVHSPG